MSNNWSQFNGTSLDALVRTIYYEPNQQLIYFGGAFTQMDTPSISGDNVSRIAVSNPNNSYKCYPIPNNVIPTPPGSYNGEGTNTNGTNGIVYAVYVNIYNNTGQPIIVGGGSFSKVYYDCFATGLTSISIQNIEYVNNVAYWDGAQQYYSGWNMMFTLIPELNGSVRALTYTSSDIYVGGEFTVAATTELNFVARWNIADELWYPIVSNNQTGVNDIIYALTNQLFQGTWNIYLGGKFTQGGNIPLNYIGKYNTTSNNFTQFKYLSDIGFDQLVLSLYVNPLLNSLTVGGGFNTTNGGALQNVWHVARVNLSTNTINTIRNISGTHTGLDGPAYAVYNNFPYIYFGGSFNVTNPTQDLALSNCAYFDASAVSNPATLFTTGTGVFIDTQTLSNTSNSLTIPGKYKLVNLVRSADNPNTWIVAFRSIGVTFD